MILSNSRNRERLLLGMGYAFIVLLFAALTYYIVLRTQIKSICEVCYDVPDEYAIPAILEYTNMVKDRLANYAVLSMMLFGAFCIAAFIVIRIELKEMNASRNESSFVDLPKDKADVFNPLLLDSIGLCKMNEERIKLAEKETDVTEFIALDYIYQLRSNLVLKRKTSSYQKAFLQGVKSNSQFSSKVSEINEVIENENKLDMKGYRTKYKEREKIYGVFKLRNITKD